MTTSWTLSGTLGGEATAITVQVVRKDENYGSFEREVGTQVLSGTWCDIGGATGVAVPPPQTPPAPSASARSESEIEITWSAVSGATRYYLYRSTSSDGTYALIGDNISTLRYRDSGLSENTEYFYRLEACNSIGCSATLSPAVSVTTQATPPRVAGQCYVGQMLTVGDSCTWSGETFRVIAGGNTVTFDDYSSGGPNTVWKLFGNGNGYLISFTRSGDTWELTELCERGCVPPNAP